jgi:F0F1-type ATP synthase membrane subunit b/b'
MIIENGEKEVLEKIQKKLSEAEEKIKQDKLRLQVTDENALDEVIDEVVAETPAEDIKKAMIRDVEV